MIHLWPWTQRLATFAIACMWSTMWVQGPEWTPLVELFARLLHGGPT